MSTRCDARDRLRLPVRSTTIMFVLAGLGACSSPDDQLQCPHPSARNAPGQLHETAAQISRIGTLLARGGPNGIPTAVAGLRSRHPHASSSAVANALIVAYCPEVKARPELSLAEKKDQIRSFAAKAYAVSRQ